MSKILDLKDWKILSHLCENARYSHNQIAKRVGLSKNSVTYRINRLIQNNIIQGFFCTIDYKRLNYSFFEVFFKLNKSKAGLIPYLTSHSNIVTLERLSGEWDIVTEFGCSSIHEFYAIIHEIKSKFADVIDTYEVHPVLSILKIEQLPVELIKKKKPQIIPDKISLNDFDKKLLFELNKDSTSSLIDLAKTLKVTTETISSHIKKLVNSNIIQRFTPKINLHFLGYDIYLIFFSLRNLSIDKESFLSSYIIKDKKVRFAYFSSAKPLLVVYYAVKNTDQLDIFLTKTKEQFSDIIINQKYLLTKELLKYELFPEAFLNKNL